MRWVILVLWAVLTLVLVFRGSISSTEVYLGASMMLAAEYVAVEAKSDK